MEQTILADRLGFAESPRWYDDRLWISDMARHLVLAVSLDGSVDVICEVPGSPSGLGWLPDGRLLITSMHDRQILQWHKGSLSVYCDLNSLVTNDLNDMIVTRAGNCYVGNFGYTPGPGVTPQSTGLILVRPDGSSEMQPGRLFRPNGIVVSEDGATVIVAETRVHRLTAYSVNGDGRLTDERQFADLPSGSWADGICLDSNGCIWVADPKRQRAILVAEGGKIVSEIVTAPQPTVAVALGGQDGRTLFMTQAPIRPMAEGRRDPVSRITMVRVEVPGVGIP